jgi:putative hydrolase of the HAD superfamily
MALVAFDVDDTLYLERDYVASGFGAVGAQLGRPDVAAACLELFAAGVRGDTFDRALRRCGLEPSAVRIAEVVRVYREHVPAIALAADARSCLDRLAGRAFLGVITDGPAASQRAKITALGLDARVDRAIVTADLGEGRGKPDPLAYVLLEEAAGELGAACAYVGDNPAKDFRAPAERGWVTVRIRRPGGLHAHVPSGADVQHEITDMDALESLL